METENPIQIGEFQKREPQPSTSRNYGLRSNTVSTTVKELQKREDDYVTIETLNYRDVWEACTEALKMKKLVGITGYPGAGKTTTLEKFRSKYSSAVTSYDTEKEELKKRNIWDFEKLGKRPATVLYVRATASMKAKDLFREIFLQLGSDHYDYSLNTLVNMSADAIRKRVSNSDGGLVIIDEAGKLNQNMLEIIHEFRDTSDYGFGIVLSGPESLHKDIQDMVRRGKRGMAELSSRISEWVELRRPTKSEIRAIITSNGIDEQPFMDRCIAQCSDYRKLYNMIKDYKAEKL